MTRTRSNACWLRLMMGLILCVAIWGLSASEARAQGVTCSATMTDVNFGTVDLVTGGTLSANATLNYTCTNTNDSQRFARLCFNIGDGSASLAAGATNFNPRLMASGSNRLKFQLYQGSTPTTIWGSNGNTYVPDPYDTTLTIPAKSGGVNGIGKGSFTMRGELLTNQASVPAGSYTTNFSGNHTAFYFGISTTSGGVPANCAVSTSGGTFAFNVSATVDRSCVVSAVALDFGTVDGIQSSANIDSTSTITVTCSPSTAYNVLLIPSNGSNNGSSSMKGQTSGNNDTVPYRLYSNPGRSTAWGSQNANDVSGVGAGTAQTLTVYGRVPGLPNVQPDNYKDTVTVNVTY